MFENQEVKVYSFGFEYDYRFFCWKAKELYSMSHTKGNRRYELKRLKQTLRNKTVGYVIAGDFKSMKTLKQLTKAINHKEIVVVVDRDCPF